MRGCNFLHFKCIIILFSLPPYALGPVGITGVNMVLLYTHSTPLKVHRPSCQKGATYDDPHIHRHCATDDRSSNLSLCTTPSYERLRCEVWFIQWF
nr:MAG TPA: hypothetical protein [Caudoviricetes sp.]